MEVVVVMVVAMFVAVAVVVVVLVAAVVVGVPRGSVCHPTLPPLIHDHVYQGRHRHTGPRYYTPAPRILITPRHVWGFRTLDLTSDDGQAIKQLTRLLLNYLILHTSRW